ncbi:uncharacterized protein LOC117646347 [Thrips palmi]|uniref:Uncharacterized protein LOC117646347 n=1 Tax=Thrips palmi TaxID=161013 RepID=A0A6P8YSV9_THRPL|nr:uncharacterized protein LOC117646347 [Thrips palmi]
MDPGTVAGKRLYLMQMLILPLIPIAAVIAQNSVMLYDMRQILTNAEHLGTQIALTAGVSRLLVAFQRERGEMANYIFSRGNRTDLTMVFDLTDEVIRSTPTAEWHGMFNRDKAFDDHLSRISSKREGLVATAKNVTRSASAALYEMGYYNKMNLFILDKLSQRISETRTSGSWRLLIAYKNLLRAAEHTSISMVFGLHYFGLGALPGRCFSRWARHDALSLSHLQSAKLFSPGLERRLGRFDADNGNLAADIVRW